MNISVIIITLVLYFIGGVLEVGGDKNFKRIGIIMKTMTLLCLTTVVFVIYFGNKDNLSSLKTLIINFKNVNEQSNSALYFITLVLYLKNIFDVFLNLPKDLKNIDKD